MTDQQPQPQQQSNNVAALSKMLANLNWPTVALIVLTGGANVLTTSHQTGLNRDEIDRALKQVRDLHDAIEDTDKRQRDALAILQELRSRK